MTINRTGSFVPCGCGGSCLDVELLVLLPPLRTQWAAASIDADVFRSMISLSSESNTCTNSFKLDGECIVTFSKTVYTSLGLLFRWFDGRRHRAMVISCNRTKLIFCSVSIQIVPPPPPRRPCVWVLLQAPGSFSLLLWQWFEESAVVIVVCNANCVFPVPAQPINSVMVPIRIPPCNFWSNVSQPVETYLWWSAGSNDVDVSGWITFNVASEDVVDDSRECAVV